MRLWLQKPPRIVQDLVRNLEQIGDATYGQIKGLRTSAYGCFGRVMVLYSIKLMILGIIDIVKPENAEEKSESGLRARLYILPCSMLLRDRDLSTSFFY